MLPKQELPWGGDVLQSSSPLRTEALLFGIGPAVFQEKTYSISDAELRLSVAGEGSVPTGWTGWPSSVASYGTDRRT